MTRRAGALMTAAVLTVSMPTATASGSAPVFAGEHAFPVVGPAWFAKGHHDYPATDIMAACGLTVVSPVHGTVHELSRVDRWQQAVDDPATRGGRFVSIIGRDGVRYYLAHFDSLQRSLRIGSWVTPGQPIGTVGRTGRSGACHVHFGLSGPCGTTGEWWVRRGVVSPYPHLTAWRAGRDSSPVGSLDTWSQRHPTACHAPPSH